MGLYTGYMGSTWGLGFPKIRGYLFWGVPIITTLIFQNFGVHIGAPLCRELPDIPGRSLHGIRTAAGSVASV